MIQSSHELQIIINGIKNGIGGGVVEGLGMEFTADIFLLSLYI